MLTSPSVAAFAELAFVNVAFSSSQFWVLVVVDFVMLLMRDVRAILLLIYISLCALVS